MSVKKEAVTDALRSVMDPEIGIDVVSLGLVYDVNISSDGDVHIKMTMTTPGCPLVGMMTEDAKNVIETIDGVKSVNVELVWDPPWTPDLIEPEVRARLGI